MNNHIFLVFGYMSELVELARVQRWITLTRETTRNQKLLAVLDRKNTEIITRKIKLQDEMFEIQRSN